MHIKKMMNAIIEKGKKSDMEYIGDIFVNSIYDLKECNPAMYKNIEYNMHKMAYGNNLTEEMALCWVAEMKNKDGSIGQHWTKSQTDDVMKQYNINADSNDWYAILNSVYSDYYNTKFGIAEYVELAKDWLMDKDVSDCKTLKYYMFIANPNPCTK